MGVSNSPDIKQQKMNDLFHGFGFIQAYIYDMLILIQNGEPHPLRNINIDQISYFRNLNKQLNPKPYSMPKINEILLKLEGFQYAMSFDSNMGYYHI